MYSFPWVFKVPYPQIQPTADHVLLQQVFTEKNPYLSEPIQFKCMLFQGHLLRISEAIPLSKKMCLFVYYYILSRKRKSLTVTKSTFILITKKNANCFQVYVNCVSFGGFSYSIYNYLASILSVLLGGGSNRSIGSIL